MDGWDAARQQEVYGRLDIWDLHARYAMAVDERDWEMLAACYVPEARFVSGLPGISSQEGREAIVARQRSRHEQQTFRERHLTAAAVIIRLDGDEAETAAEVVIVSRRPDSPPTLEAMGRYRDRLVRRGGRWFFLERRFEPDVI